MDKGEVPSSFRDPSGFLFRGEGSIYRQINFFYKENYNLLTHSGLYKDLTDNSLLISHKETDVQPLDTDKAYKVIEPEIIPFISYPYEWCFNQLKDAALTTLSIQKRALKFDMSLKDCSAYNIQFKNGKPIFIDTLSFEKYREGEPWVAYRQFCQHFLAPLALMCHTDIRLNQLFRTYIDGIPLDLASKLLPFKTRFSFPLLLHIHLHSKSQSHFADKTISKGRRKMSRLAHNGFIDSLESIVRKLTWQPKGTEWGDYYKDTNYSPDAAAHKKQLLNDFLTQINPKAVWDFGSNEGTFSRIASDRGIQTVSFDIDPAAIEKNYRQCVQKKESNILPLLLDLTNPSPGIGWENRERMSLLKRGPADAVFALALIHHLAISNNLPFGKIADFFSKICKSLIIEFVPKNDSQVERLLLTREDIFPNYTQQSFEDEFKKYFKIKTITQIKNSKRTLFYMER